MKSRQCRTMKPTEQRVLMLAATLVITVGGYFLDMGLLSNKILNVDYFKQPERNDTQPEITIITMYLNIGRFQKGEDTVFTPDTYKDWMKTWGWLTNRVIGIFDTEDTLNMFRQMRSAHPEDRTVLLKVNRSDLPAFKDIETIRRIYNSPGYPKHHPNTVVPEYSCAMNAKYDALQIAITRGLVDTNFMAWLDIGYFRYLLDSEDHPSSYRFILEVPANFDPNCVSMSEINPRTKVSDYSPWKYIRDNIVWVSGGLLLGTKEAVWTFSESYKQMVSQLLKQNMFSTDQQVIGAMYSPGYIQKQKVRMRPYTCDDLPYYRRSKYFCLGYIAKFAAENRHKDNRTTILTS